MRMTCLTKLDQFMAAFCIDALRTLESQDKWVAEHLLNSQMADFHAEDSKGLGLFGTCERDLQYIIFTELYQSDCLYPEYVGPIVLFKKIICLDL